MADPPARRSSGRNPSVAWVALGLLELHGGLSRNRGRTRSGKRCYSNSALGEKAASRQWACTVSTHWVVDTKVILCNYYAITM